MSYTEQLIAEAMCDEIKELKAENKKLKEENKALKEVEEENKDIKEKITKLKQDMLEMLEAEDSSTKILSLRKLQANPLKIMMSNPKKKKKIPQSSPVWIAGLRHH